MVPIQLPTIKQPIRKEEGKKISSEANNKIPSLSCFSLFWSHPLLFAWHRTLALSWKSWFHCL